jgi:hypothetical protein
LIDVWGVAINLQDSSAWFELAQCYRLKSLDALLSPPIIPTVPITTPYYNVITNFTNPLVHHAEATLHMWPMFQGRKCMPTNDSSTKRCTVDGYPEYAVKLTDGAQIQLVVDVARAADLRLVNKNTGHSSPRAIHWRWSLESLHAQPQ